MSIILDVPQSPSTMETFAALAQEFRRCLSTYEADPLSKSVIDNCMDARRRLAAVVAQWPKSEKEGPRLDELREIFGKIAVSGFWDQAVDPKDTAMVAELSTKSWAGLLGSMLVVPAWLWPQAPRIEDVPLFLWDIFSAYAFYVPGTFFESNQAEQFNRQYLKRLEELCRLAETNRGSAAVRSALSVYLTHANAVPLCLSSGNLKRHFELRGRILRHACNVGTQDQLFINPREGRRLKIGFISQDFGPRPETYATLPSFEFLDTERFELRLFALKQTGSPIEAHIVSKSDGIVFLPEVFDQQVSALRNESLDVLVFCTDIAAGLNDVTRMALQRIAPLQVANSSSSSTTGLAEIDVFVSGALAETDRSAEQYSERLALLPGPAHAFNFTVDAVEPSCSMTRADLQVPDDAVLFVTACNFAKIGPEMMDCWAEMLSRVPSAYLLVHPFSSDNRSENALKRFNALFEQTLQKRGVEHSRLVISTIPFGNRSDVRVMLALGDVYLDSYPYCDVSAIMDPLEKCIPVVEWEGDSIRSRSGSAILRQLGLDECCAKDRESYLDLCVKLAADPALRASLRERVGYAIQRIPLFLDTLAASDAFGELMNIAFDELCLKGNVEFRKDRSVIAASLTEDPSTLLSTSNYLMEIGMTNEALAQVNNILASIPNHIEARHRMARNLSAAGRHDRAAEYLLAIVQSNSATSLYWRELSTEFRFIGNGEGARQALEASLRMDPSDVETWLVLGDLAWESRHEDILNEVLGILPQVAPEDPRVKAFIERGKLPSEPSAS